MLVELCPRWHWFLGSHPSFLVLAWVPLIQSWPTAMQWSLSRKVKLFFRTCKRCTNLILLCVSSSQHELWPDKIYIIMQDWSHFLKHIFIHSSGLQQKTGSARANDDTLESGDTYATFIVLAYFVLRRPDKHISCLTDSRCWTVILNS